MHNLLHLVTGWVVEADVCGREEAIENLPRDDNAFTRWGEWVSVLDNEETISGNGDALEVTLDIFDVGQLSGRAGPLCKVGMGAA